MSQASLPDGGSTSLSGKSRNGGATWQVSTRFAPESAPCASGDTVPNLNPATQHIRLPDARATGHSTTGKSREDRVLGGWCRPPVRDQWLLEVFHPRRGSEGSGRSPLRGAAPRPSVLGTSSCPIDHSCRSVFMNSSKRRGGPCKRQAASPTSAFSGVRAKVFNGLGSEFGTTFCVSRWACGAVGAGADRGAG